MLFRYTTGAILLLTLLATSLPAVGQTSIADFPLPGESNTSSRSTAPTGGDAYRVWDVALQGNHTSGDDIAATVQRGLSTQHEHGLPVYIPAGNWRWSKTVTAPFRSGGHLFGFGASEKTGPRQDENPTLGGASTRIAWTGANEGIMLRVTGVHFRLSGICFHGHDYGTTSTPQAGVGLLISKNGKKGLGTGKCLFDDLMFEELPIAIQNGASGGEANCESNTYRNIRFDKCGVGFKLLNTQGMGHFFDAIDGPCEVMFDVYGGGMLHARNILCWKKLLRLSRNPDHHRHSPGPANGTFTFDNVKVDYQARKTFQAVEMTAPVHADIELNTGRISHRSFGKEGGTFATLQGFASLTVRGWAGDFTGSIRGHSNRKGQQPNVLLDRCRLWCDPNEIAQGKLTFATRDCYTGTAAPIEINRPTETED